MKLARTAILPATVMHRMKEANMLIEAKWTGSCKPGINLNAR